MRTIIAGSRSITDISCVQLAMSQCSWTPSLVLSGTARGVDQLGEQWAKENNIKVARFPADWSSHGKGAGYIRNELMADNADALVALWDGESRGTKHMIKIARSKKLMVFLWTLPAPLMSAMGDSPGIVIVLNPVQLYTTLCKKEIV